MSLSLVLGRCDSLRAEVFLRAALPASATPAGAVITGSLKGPECRRAITLPVTATFLPLPADASHANSIVGRAVLTEPSYWTPELPSLYQMKARVVASGLGIETCEQAVGLRRFGVRGRSLWLDGRRFVPRGLLMPERDIDLKRFREASLTAMVADPSEAFLKECDAEGVPVIAILADERGSAMNVDVAAERIGLWSWHASVLLAVVPLAAREGEGDRIAAATRRARGTLLLGLEVDGSMPPPTTAISGDAIVVSLAANAVPHSAWRTTPPAVPCLAIRPHTPDAVVSRGPCDSLQAGLASWRSGDETPGAAWDWAGYCVEVCAQGT